MQSPAGSRTKRSPATGGARERLPGRPPPRSPGADRRRIHLGDDRRRAAIVFLTVGVSRRLLDGMLGFAAGVMIAASFWSLLAPAIEMSGGSFFPATVGFLIGGVFLWGIDKVLPHLHMFQKREEAEGPKTTWQRTTLLVLAITLHNIPEGLAVGVAFGPRPPHSRSHPRRAVALALGIGIQNFPEGLAISGPLRREGVEPFRSFWYGQASAVVEPVAAVIGAAAVMGSRAILPYALAFAAGAMIFVVVEELIPESQRGNNTDLATLTTWEGSPS